MSALRRLAIPDDRATLRAFDALIEPRPRLRLVGPPPRSVTLHKPEDYAATLRVSDRRFIAFADALEAGDPHALRYFDQVLVPTRAGQFIQSGRFGAGTFSPYTDAYFGASGTATAPALVAHCDLSSQAAGGGGNSYATAGNMCGGGGGGCAKSNGLSVSAGDQLNYAPGTGGAGAPFTGASSNGSTGGASTTSSGNGGFTGVAHNALGGVGATAASGAGGTASGGSTSNTTGGAGSTGSAGKGGNAADGLGVGGANSDGTTGGQGGGLGAGGGGSRIVDGLPGAGGADGVIKFAWT